jgi:hypothetical protein
MHEEREEGGDVAQESRCTEEFFHISALASEEHMAVTI